MKNLYLSFVLLLSTVAAFAQTTDLNKPRVVVSGEIQSQTWSADNQYFLDGRVYVAPGATLTIDPGVVSRPSLRLDFTRNNHARLVQVSSL
ncbi:MAG: hypothetical protein AAFQ87_16140, partial [Bacteroidota bacterium]